MPALSVALACFTFFGCERPIGLDDGSSPEFASEAMEKIETAYYEGAEKVETGTDYATIVKLMKQADIQYVQFNSRHTSLKDISGGYDVGVIPTSRGACPLASEKVQISIDNEDKNTKTSKSGSWNSSWEVTSGGNTMMYFCKADGRLFSNAPGSFSVLKLGGNKPQNVKSVTQLFMDCEDNDAATGFVSNPNDGAPNYVDGNRNLMTYWYVFNNTSGGSFPNLGMEYGVLGYPQSEISSSIYYTDDEDGNNKNWMKTIEGPIITDPNPQISAVGISFAIGATATPYFLGDSWLGIWGVEAPQGTNFRLARVK